MPSQSDVRPRRDNTVIGFHLDLKVAHYRADYLKQWFPRLATAGYTHVFIETEDKVLLESTRGAAWCEAYSKEAFAGLLADIRRAGMTPIPLIQTLGHLEFLLSHSAYHDLRESPGSAYMLCPSKPESVRFLVRYMDEVGELFGNPPFIHLGADEAWALGHCAQCRSRVAASSKSDLFVEHMQTLFDHASSRGWRPIAWADMILANSGSIDRFSRDAVWMDWDYWTQEFDSAIVRHWPSGAHSGPEILSPEFLKSDMGCFAKSADGRIRPWFYSDYLLDKGFDVILAPSTRCGGDHVFAPDLKHLGNVMSAVLRADRTPRPLGVLVTSWAVRLNHIETQWPAIQIPRVAADHAASTWREIAPELADKAIGKPLPSLFDAWEKLSPSFALADSWRAIEMEIHYYGQHDSMPYLLNTCMNNGEEVKERTLLEELSPRHAQGIRILDDIAREIPQPNLCLRFWRFAARAIAARAEEELLFLDTRNGRPDSKRAGHMLMRLEALQDEYRALLLETYTPASVERELGMIFAGPWRHLSRLASGKTT